MTAGFVSDKRRNGSPFTSRSAEKVERVLERFMRSLRKPTTHQAARESRLTRCTILFEWHKILNYRPWNPHYLQDLKPADCDCRIEYGELMLGWHGVCGKT